MDTAQGQYVFGTGLAPEHARLFAARADHGFAAGLDHPGTNEEALAAKSPVFHSLHIMDEVPQLLLDRLSLRLASTFLAGFLDEVFHTVAQQAPDPPASPSFVFGVLLAPQQRLHHITGMIDGVPKVNDLDSILKIQLAHLLQTGGP